MAGTSFGEQQQRDDEQAASDMKAGAPYSVRSRLEAHRSGHGEDHLLAAGSAITRRSWDGVCAG